MGNLYWIQGQNMQFQHSHASAHENRWKHDFYLLWNTNIPTALKKVYKFFLFYLKIKIKSLNKFEEPRREFKRVRFPRFWNFTFPKMLKLIALDDNFITQWLGIYQIWSVTVNPLGSWHARKWPLEFE